MLLVLESNLQERLVEMSQEALQEIMRKVEGEPYADVLSMMLRSMQQARYSEHNHGHYEACCWCIPTHFTSPIRRYPDLMVHRIVLSMANPKKWLSTLNKSFQALQPIL